MGHVKNRTENVTDLSAAVGRALRHHQTDHRWKVARVERVVGMTQRLLGRKLDGESEWRLAEFLAVCAAVGADVPAIIAKAVDYLADPAKQTPSARAVPDNVPEPANDQSPADATVTPIGVNWDAYQGAKAADNDVEADHEPQ